jgi:hypothetical protein
LLGPLIKKIALFHPGHLVWDAAKLHADPPIILSHV